MSEKLSVIVPVHNEQEVLPAFHARLRAVLDGIEMDADVIYVNDGSEDGSAACLGQLREQDSDVSVLELSRNFGKEVAMTAGLDHADGDVAVVIDADLQDPPELIPDLLAQWRAGYDVVYAVRSSREGESWLKMTTARWFYRIINRLSDVEIPRDTGDFRLLSRRALEAVRSLRETHRYMKGLYAWVGFPCTSIRYERSPRQAGKTSWNYWRLWNFALEGITSFSTVPLRLATYLGVITSGLAFIYGAYFLIRTLLLGNPVPGYPSLIIIILFLGGVQLVCIGIIGEYLGRTYNESKQRTLYFISGFHPGDNGSEGVRPIGERHQ